MRFGSHSHADRNQRDAKVNAEHDRLVTTLRGLADRIERVNVDQLGDGLVSIAAAVDPLVRAVERALGRQK